MLLTAMCHSSYANESSETVHDNEQLGFLGDAVLELRAVISCFISIHRCGGKLTKLRASIV